MNYPQICARIFNTPLLIHPQKLDAMVAGLGPRLLGAPSLRHVGQLEGEPIKPELFSTRKGERTERGYSVVDGVAVLGINGALVHRTKFEAADSTLMLGYNDLAADVEDAMANPAIHAVLQVYQSPGGEAQGAFEFGDRIMAMRGKKPIKAIADGMAASAAFIGAAATDELVVTETGYAGSIGVVMRHVDFSRALANDGITVTHIFAGAHKVDGNPFEALPEAVRADFQAEINSLYGMFVSAIARYTGLSEDAIRATQARTYMGQSAVGAGLARRVSTTDQLITELAGLRARSYPVGQSARSTQAHDKGAHMSGTPTAADGTQTANNQAGASATFTQADLDRARAAGREEGVTAGTTAERTRVSAVLALPGAGTHQALALQCISLGLTAEQSTAVLAAAPAAPAAAAGQANNFAATMAAIGNPPVSGVEGKGSGGEPDAAALASQIVASFHGATAAR